MLLQVVIVADHYIEANCMHCSDKGAAIHHSLIFTPGSLSSSVAQKRESQARMRNAAHLTGDGVCPIPSPSASNGKMPRNSGIADDIRSWHGISLSFILT